MPRKIDSINLQEMYMFIWMQYINFIPPFFLEMGMPGYDHPKWSYQLVKKLWYVSSCKKLYSSLTFLEILLGYCELVILGTLGMPGHAHQKQWYQLVGNFHVYLQKINLMPPFFHDILHFKEFCNLILQEQFAP